MADLSGHALFVMVIVCLIVLCSACGNEISPSVARDEQKLSQAKAEQEERLLLENRLAMIKRAEELQVFDGPVQLSNHPYVRVKGVVVRGDDIEKSTSYFRGTIISEEETAKTVDEINGAIQVHCVKGARIGLYSTQYITKPTPAFAITCRVSILDLTIPAIVGQRSFSNNKLPGTLRLRFARDELIAPVPLDEITRYVKSLPRK